jgi:hypothetical protein
LLHLLPSSLFRGAGLGGTWTKLPVCILQAARYQMIIMFMIAATTAVGSTATILLGAFWIVDSCGMLRFDRLVPRVKTDSFANRFAKAADTVRRFSYCIVVLHCLNLPCFPVISISMYAHFVYVPNPLWPRMQQVGMCIEDGFCPILSLLLRLPAFASHHCRGSSSQWPVTCSGQPVTFALF